MGRTLFAEATAVVDASVLIDMRKAGLHIEFLGLPMTFVIPVAVMEDEALDFPASDWSSMKEHGLEGDENNELTAAEHALAPASGLSAYDRLLLSTTRRRGGLLLTADAALRRTAERADIEAHGVLWLWDRLREAGRTSDRQLWSALETWRDDPTVFLPRSELDVRLASLARGHRGGEEKTT